MYPEQFEDLIEAFSHLPGVGRKSAERYAFTILGWSPENIQQFQKAVGEINEIHTCEICGNICSGNKCSICEDDTRNKNIICVVKSPKDLAVIESMNEYEGVYHVLNGLINTRKGILPESLNIESLEKRINKETEEVILALDPNVDGETTALYLERLLQNETKISRLASGIPMGSQLDYVDSRTLHKAFEGRK